MINRLFILTCAPEGLEDFHKVGEYNLMTSIEKEEGTYVMLSSHDSENENVNYVLESYKDEDAYQIHAHSEQFLAFADVAKKHLTDRQVMQLNIEFFGEKSEPLRALAEDHLHVRLAYIQFKENKEELLHCQNEVIQNMKTSIAQEPGVLAMYGGSVIDSPTQWWFYEIYQNEAAYQSHRETEHFKKYIQETTDHIVEKKLIVLSGDTLVNKPHYTL